MVSSLKDLSHKDLNQASVPQTRELTTTKDLSDPNQDPTKALSDLDLTANQDLEPSQDSSLDLLANQHLEPSLVPTEELSKALKMAKEASVLAANLALTLVFLPPSVLHQDPSIEAPVLVLELVVSQLQRPANSDLLALSMKFTNRLVNQTSSKQTLSQLAASLTASIALAPSVLDLNLESLTYHL